ncbi:hypothetical protein PENTCL1PPCAC_28627, partial [Pristionchus entomophagus]
FDIVIPLQRMITAIHCNEVVDPLLMSDVQFYWENRTSSSQNTDVQAFGVLAQTILLQAENHNMEIARREAGIPTNTGASSSSEHHPLFDNEIKQEECADDETYAPDQPWTNWDVDCANLFPTNTTHDAMDEGLTHQAKEENGDDGYLIPKSEIDDVIMKRSALLKQLPRGGGAFLHQCKFCWLSFRSQNHLADHVRKKHAVDTDQKVPDGSKTKMTLHNWRTTALQRSTRPAYRPSNRPVPAFIANARAVMANRNVATTYSCKLCGLMMDNHFKFAAHMRYQHPKTANFQSMEDRTAIMGRSSTSSAPDAQSPPQLDTQSHGSSTGATALVSSIASVAPPTTTATPKYSAPPRPATRLIIQPSHRGKPEQKTSGAVPTHQAIWNPTSRRFVMNGEYHVKSQSSSLPLTFRIPTVKPSILRPSTKKVTAVDDDDWDSMTAKQSSRVSNPSTSNQSMKKAVIGTNSSDEMDGTEVKEELLDEFFDQLAPIDAPLDDGVAKNVPADEQLLQVPKAANAAVNDSTEVETLESGAEDNRERRADKQQLLQAQLEAVAVALAASKDPKTQQQSAEAVAPVDSAVNKPASRPRGRPRKIPGSSTLDSATPTQSKEFTIDANLDGLNASSRRRSRRNAKAEVIENEDEQESRSRSPKREQVPQSASTSASTSSADRTPSVGTTPVKLTKEQKKAASAADRGLSSKIALTCPYCGTETNSIHSMDRHTRANHKRSELYSCTQCDSTYLALSGVESHWFKHENCPEGRLAINGTEVLTGKAEEEDIQMNAKTGPSIAPVEEKRKRKVPDVFDCDPRSPSYNKQSKISS